MKQQRIVLAGFGGQGVLTVGQLLATVAMHENFEVSWMPSYGPEMRGGTANCSVIVDDKEIGSPLISEGITILLAMNTPSLDKFLPLVETGGYVIVNASLINKEIERSDIHVIAVDFASMAKEIGNMKTQNMIAYGILGHLIAFSPLSLLEIVVKKLGHKDAELLELNKLAIEAGYQIDTISVMN